MAITTLDAISVWDLPPNVPGATCYGYLDQILSWELVKRRDAAHVATVVAPLSGNAAPLAQQRRILALHFTPLAPGQLGEVVVLRISEAVREQRADGLAFTVKARSLLFDWADAGPMAHVYAGGHREYAIAGELSVVDWATTYMLPHLAAQGYGWYEVVCGNGQRSPQAFSRWTPLELLNACVDFLGWELRIFPWITGWRIEVVEQVNGIAEYEPLRVTVGHNLRRVTQRVASLEQATVLVPFGETGHSEVSKSIQRMQFLGANVDYGLAQVDPFPVAESPSGWAFPVVQFDGQFVDPTGARSWYLQRVRTGRSFRIVQSWGPTPSEPTGRVQLASLTQILDALVFELREGLTPATSVDVPVPGFPLRVTAPPVGNVVTVANPFSATDPVPTDNVHLDCLMRRSTLVLATTSTTVVTIAGTTEQTLTVASTAGVQAGDWGFAHNNVAQPWGLFGKPFTVVQVVSATQLRIRVRYSFDTSPPFSAGALVKQVRCYRAVAGFLGYVDAETAAANTLTLSSVTGLATDDLLEFTLENSGAALSGLPSPLVAQYGITRKSRAFSNARCVVNLLHSSNPVFDDFTGTAPDQWTQGGIGNPTKITTLLPGPGTIHAVQLSGNNLQTLTSPIVWPRVVQGLSQVAVRVRLRTGTGSFWDGSLASHHTKVELLVANGGAVLATTMIHPPGHPSPPAGSEEVAPDTTIDLDLLAVDCLHTPGAGARYAPWDGVQVRISAVNGGGNPTLGGVMVVLDGSLPSGFVIRGQQDAYGLGQLALRDLAAPETTNDIDVVDLQRALEVSYGTEQLLEGRVVRVEAEALGLAFEERLDAVTYRGSEDGAAQVQVATRTRLFADVLATYLSAQGA